MNAEPLCDLGALCVDPLVGLVRHLREWHNAEDWRVRPQENALECPLAMTSFGRRVHMLALQLSVGVALVGEIWFTRFKRLELLVCQSPCNVWVIVARKLIVLMA